MQWGAFAGGAAIALLTVRRAAPYMPRKCPDAPLGARCAGTAKGPHRTPRQARRQQSAFLRMKPSVKTVCNGALSNMCSPNRAQALQSGEWAGLRGGAPGQHLRPVVVLDLEVEVVLLVLGHKLAGRHVHADLHLALVPGLLRRAQRPQVERTVPATLQQLLLSQLFHGPSRRMTSPLSPPAESTDRLGAQAGHRRLCLQRAHDARQAAAAADCRPHKPCVCVSQRAARPGAHRDGGHDEVQALGGRVDAGREAALVAHVGRVLARARHSLSGFMRRPYRAGGGSGRRALAADSPDPALPCRQPMRNRWRGSCSAGQGSMRAQPARARSGQLGPRVHTARRPRQFSGRRCHAAPGAGGAPGRTSS